MAGAALEAAGSSRAAEAAVLAGGGVAEAADLPAVAGPGVADGDAGADAGRRWRGTRRWRRLGSPASSRRRAGRSSAGGGVAEGASFPALGGPGVADGARWSWAPVAGDQ